MSLLFPLFHFIGPLHCYNKIQVLSYYTHELSNFVLSKCNLSIVRLSLLCPYSLGFQNLNIFIHAKCPTYVTYV